VGRKETETRVATITLDQTNKKNDMRFSSQEKKQQPAQKTLITGSLSTRQEYGQQDDSNDLSYTIL